MGKFKNKGIGRGTNGNPQNSLHNYQTWQKNNLSNASKYHSMNLQKQNKHVEGGHDYVEGKSIITASLGSLQDYYNNHRDEVEMINDHKGRLAFNRIIGIYIDKETGERSPTNKVISHYSKNGYHMVPARPNKDGGK